MTRKEDKEGSNKIKERWKMMLTTKLNNTIDKTASDVAEWVYVFVYIKWNIYNMSRKMKMRTMNWAESDETYRQNC
jgi:hypothetical protein